MQHHQLTLLFSKLLMFLMIRRLPLSHQVSHHQDWEASPTIVQPTNNTIAWSGQRQEKVVTAVERVRILHTTSHPTTTIEFHTMVSSMRSSLKIPTLTKVKALSTLTLTIVQKVISTCSSRESSKSLSGLLALICSRTKRVIMQEKQLAYWMLPTVCLTHNTIMKIVFHKANMIMRCSHTLQRMSQSQHRTTRKS